MRRDDTEGRQHRRNQICEGASEMTGLQHELSDCKSSQTFHQVIPPNYPIHFSITQPSGAFSRVLLPRSYQNHPQFTRVQWTINRHQHKWRRSSKVLSRQSHHLETMTSYRYTNLSYPQDKISRYQIRHHRRRPPLLYRMGALTTFTVQKINRIYIVKGPPT